MLPVHVLVPPVGTTIGGPPFVHFEGAGPVGSTGTHAPFEQPWPGVWQAALEQLPQCALSVLRSTHWLPHLTSGGGQVVEQPFDTHAWPAGHTLPQPPQLFGSTAVGIQAPLQKLWPYGHPHWPPRHCSPA